MTGTSNTFEMIVAPWSKLFQQTHAEALLFFSQTSIQQANQQAVEILGWDNSALQGQYLGDILQGEHDEPLETLLQQAQGKFVTAWLTVSSGERKRVYCFVRQFQYGQIALSCLHFLESNLLSVAKSTPSNSALIIQDFIQRSDARSNRIFNNTHHCFFDWNLTDDLFEWNQVGWQLLGYSEDQINQLKPSFALIYQHIHPQDQAAFLEVIEKHKKTETALHIEFRLYNVAQQIKYISLKADFNYYKDKLFLSGSIDDISSYKQAIEQVNNFNQQTKNIIESLNLVVWRWNTGSDILTVSKNFWSCLGLSSRTLSQELPLSDLLYYVHPEDKEGVQLIFSQDVPNSQNEYEFQFKHANSHYIWLKCAFTDLLNSDSSLKQRSGFFIDITRDKNMQATLSNAKLLAEQANKAKSDFLSQMSHELRTPLNAILGFGQILCMDDEGLSSEQKGYVLEIEKAGKHLLALIDEILDLSKLEAGHIKIELSELELSIVVQECQRTVQNLLNKYQVNLHIDYAQLQTICVYADRLRIKQVILNLLTNAIKYNYPNGNVWLLARNNQEGRINVMVKDDGQGIPAKKQKELFQPFNRLGRDFSEIEGTGIGLMLTKKLVELMQGHLHFQSEEGKGTSFWFDMPRQAPAPVHTESVNVSRAPSKYQILYVEDSYTNFQLVRSMIESVLSCEISHARTAEQAINKAVKSRPDLVLMNINLPGMNGFQALSSFKMNPLTEQVPIIAITNNLLSVVNHTSEYTFSGVLSKPIEHQKLITLLKKFLKQDA